jgi:hypothetical protein
MEKNSYNTNRVFSAFMIILLLNNRDKKYNNLLQLIDLGQGSQTQIYRGPHFEGKSLRGPHFRVRSPLQAAMWKNMSYLVHNFTIFEHFLSFNHQN